MILNHKKYLHSLTDNNNINYPLDINSICKNICLQKDMKIKSNISPVDIIKKNNELKTVLIFI